MAFLCVGPARGKHHSTWGLMRAERGRIPSLTLLAVVPVVQPCVQLAFWAASVYSWVMSSLSSIKPSLNFVLSSSLNFMFSHTSLADFKILGVFSHLPSVGGIWPSFAHLVSGRGVRTSSLQVGQVFLLLSKVSSSTMQCFHSLWFRILFFPRYVNCKHVGSYPKDNVRKYLA